jgi:hypothetical protein
MCEQCEKVDEVLTELTGVKVAGVIMRRVEPRVHPLNAEEFSTTPIAVTA